jgi:hypothetical protein
MVGMLVNPTKTVTMCFPEMPIPEPHPSYNGVALQIVSKFRYLCVYLASSIGFFFFFFFGGESLYRTRACRDKLLELNTTCKYATAWCQCRVIHVCCWCPDPCFRVVPMRVYDTGARELTFGSSDQPNESQLD